MCSHDCREVDGLGCHWSFIAKNRELIASVVETDTRKLSTWDEFQVATANEIPEGQESGRHLPLKTFFERRRTYLLANKDVAGVTVTENHKEPDAKHEEPAEITVKPGSSVILNE